MWGCSIYLTIHGVLDPEIEENIMQQKKDKTPLQKWQIDSLYLSQKKILLVLQTAGFEKPTAGNENKGIWNE